jgi:hypothetical protein
MSLGERGGGEGVKIKGSKPPVAMDKMTPPLSPAKKQLTFYGDVVD